MLCVGCLIIVNGQNIKKISLENSMIELPRVENCISRLCPSPLGTPPPPRPNTQNRVKNTQRGYCTFTVLVLMYKGQGAGERPTQILLGCSGPKGGIDGH